MKLETTSINYSQLKPHLHFVEGLIFDNYCYPTPTIISMNMNFSEIIKSYQASEESSTPPNFKGCIPHDDIKRMTAAIEEAFEQVDLNEWE